MSGVFGKGKGSCSLRIESTKGGMAAETFGHGDEVMDITPGYIIRGIAQKSADCIIAEKNIFFTVDEKDRNFKRIKSLQKKGICAVYDIIYLHTLHIITCGLLSGSEYNFASVVFLKFLPYDCHL